MSTDVINPAGPITSHVLGFTDVDDRGKKVLKKRLNSHLSGVDGQKRVLRDNKGRIVEDIESIRGGSSRSGFAN